MSFRTPQIPVEGMCRAIINWLLQATDKFIEIHIEYHKGRMLFFLNLCLSMNGKFRKAVKTGKFEVIIHHRDKNKLFTSYAFFLFLNGFGL